MTAAPLTLRRDETVADAVSALISHRLAALCVVDAQGRYVGVFGLSQAFALLLPKVATMGEGIDLSFLGDTMDHLRTHLKANADKPVHKCADAKAPKVKPETSLSEAYLLLFRGADMLPVVADDKTLAGCIYATDALAAVTGGK